MLASCTAQQSAICTAITALLVIVVGCVVHHPAVCTAIAAGVMIDDAVMLNVAMPTAPFGPDPAAGKGTGAALTGTDSTASSMSTYDCTALHTATS